MANGKALLASATVLMVGLVWAGTKPEGKATEARAQQTGEAAHLLEAGGGPAEPIAARPPAVLIPVDEAESGPGEPVAAFDARDVDPNECATAPVLSGPFPRAIDIYLPCTLTYNADDPLLSGACIGDGAYPGALYYFMDSQWIKVIPSPGQTIMIVDVCSPPDDTGHAWPADPDAIFQIVTPKVGTACVSGSNNWNNLGCFNDTGCAANGDPNHPHLERGTVAIDPNKPVWIQIGRWPADCTHLNTGWYRVTVRGVGGLCPGDMNCDGRVTFADIDLFVEALAGESQWTHWPCPWMQADCNNSTSVTFADIAPFVARIGTTCLPG